MSEADAEPANDFDERAVWCLPAHPARYRFVDRARRIGAEIPPACLPR
jgi:hypothetical protein